MSEKLFYMPDVCKNCHKVLPQNVMMSNGNYRASFSDYIKVKEMCNVDRFAKAGDNTKYPLKLFIRNGYYR